jgi:hypothetical protein
MISSEKMRKKMQENFEKFEDIFKWVVFGLSFCTVCGAGNAIIEGITGAMPGDKCKRDTECDPQTQKCDPATGSCVPKDIEDKDTEVTIPEDLCPEFTDCSIDNECPSDCYGTCLCRDCRTEEDYIFDVVIYSGQSCPGGISSAPNSPGDYQPGTSGISFADNGNGVGGVAVWTLIASAISLFLYTALLGKIFKTGDENEDVEEEKSEIVKYMEKGIKWGIAVCVMPRVVGEMGAWIAEGGSPAERGFEKVAAFGKGLGNVCNVIMRILPLVMMLIQFYISYLRFEMCMDMLEIQIEAGAQAAAQAQEPYQAQAGVQAGVTMMANMMNCFNQLMQAMNQLTMTSMFMSQQLGTFGGGTTDITYSYRGRDVSGADKICGVGSLKVDAYNFCRGGVPRQSIRIEGPGCRGYYDSESCAYSTPVMPTYPTYGGGYYGGYYGSQYSRVMSGQMSTEGCTDGGTIIVTVTGVRSIPKTFTYWKDESKCQ